MSTTSSAPTTSVRAPDVIVNDQGTVVLFVLENENARAFINENVHLESWQWLGDAAFAVDHRYADALIEGMQEDGLTVA